MIGVAVTPAQARPAVEGKWGGFCPRCGLMIATIAIRSGTGEAVCAICAYKEVVRG